MSTATNPGNTNPAPPRPSRFAYVLTVLVTAAVTFGLVVAAHEHRRAQAGRPAALFQAGRADRGHHRPGRMGQELSAAVRQLHPHRGHRTTRHGGSEAAHQGSIEARSDDRLSRIFAGYAFSVDYREERGHAYMLADQDVTERVKQFKQPGACLHCHASIIPAYREAGGGDVMKGFEEVCAMPLAEARKLVEHPVSLHRLPRSASDAAARHPARVSSTACARWPRRKRAAAAPAEHRSAGARRRARRTTIPNAMATRQEMRSFVCGQCHVEYYFKGEGKLVTYPGTTA